MEPKERIQSFAEFYRAFLRIARNCVDLLHHWPRSRRRIPWGSVQSRDRVLVWKWVPQDYVEAAKWFRKAAERGFADGQYRLAQMMAIGQGIRQRQYRGGELCIARPRIRDHVEGGAVQPGNHVCLRPGCSKRLSRKRRNGFRKAGARSGIRGSAVQSGRSLSRRAGCRSGFPRGADVVREGGRSGIFRSAVLYRIDVFGRPGRPRRYREGGDLVPQRHDPGLPSRAIQHGRALRGRIGRAARSEQAVEWYRKAAEFSFLQAQDALRSLAGTGLPSAQHVLGMTWEYGWGSMKNEPEAVSWYRKAAEQGYPAAEYDLGRMLADGRGVPGVDAEKNRAEAEAGFSAGRRKGNTRGAPGTGDSSGALKVPRQ